MPQNPAPPYAARRARVAAALRAAGGGIAIVPTAPERQRNSDNDHPYRHGSDFHYLTGFAEPDAWLIICSDGRTTLLCRPKDIERELWDGIRLGPDAAPAALGVDAGVRTRPPRPDDGRRACRPAGRLVVVRHARARRAGRAAGSRGCAPRAPGRRARRTRSTTSRPCWRDARRQGRRRARDHAPRRRDQRRCACARDALLRSRFAPSPARRSPEYEIEAELLHEFRRHGAEGPAYGVDRRRRRQHLHPPLQPRGDAPAGRRALPRSTPAASSTATPATSRAPFPPTAASTRRSASSTTWSRQRSAPRSPRRGQARASAMRTPPRCACSLQGMLDSGLLNRTSSAISTR